MKLLFENSESSKTFKKTNPRPKTGDFTLFYYFLQHLEQPKVALLYRQKAALSGGFLFNNLACNQEQRGFFVIAFVASSELEL